MAKNKFYAVRVGIKPGIYTSWGEIEPLVKGYTGAQFKSFKTREEAQAYLRGEKIIKKKKASGDLLEALLKYYPEVLNNTTKKSKRRIHSLC